MASSSNPEGFTPFGSTDFPVRLDPFQNIVSVQWGGIFVLLEIEGGEYASGLRLRVIDPPDSPIGDTFFVFNDPTDLPDPVIVAGVKIDRPWLKPWRFVRTTTRVVATTDPGTGDIVGWLPGMEYVPTNETGSLVGLFDPCLDINTGAYCGDSECNARFTHGFITIDGEVTDVFSGGVPRHLAIADIIAAYTSDAHKRIIYSHLLPPLDPANPNLSDPRVSFNYGGPPPQLDHRLMQAEKAVLDGASTIFRQTQAWLINFSYRAPPPAGPPPPPEDPPPPEPLPRPIEIAIEFEEPGPEPTTVLGAVPDNIRIRRFSSVRFEIKTATGTSPTEGLVTLYTGGNSPKWDMKLSPIAFKGNLTATPGQIATLTKDGFKEVTAPGEVDPPLPPPP